jgi:hypothetical protein
MIQVKPVILHRLPANAKDCILGQSEFQQSSLRAPMSAGRYAWPASSNSSAHRLIDWRISAKSS